MLIPPCSQEFPVAPSRTTSPPLSSLSFYLLPYFVAHHPLLHRLRKFLDYILAIILNTDEYMSIDIDGLEDAYMEEEILHIKEVIIQRNNQLVIIVHSSQNE